MYGYANYFWNYSANYQAQGINMLAYFGADWLSSVDIQLFRGIVKKSCPVFKKQGGWILLIRYWSKFPLLSLQKCIEKFHNRMFANAIEIWTGMWILFFPLPLQDKFDWWRSNLFTEEIIIIWAGLAEMLRCFGPLSACSWWCNINASPKDLALNVEHTGYAVCACMKLLREWKRAEHSQV